MSSPLNPVSFPRRRPILATAFALGVLGSGPVRAGGLSGTKSGRRTWVSPPRATLRARATRRTVLTNPAGMTRLEGQQFLLGTQMLYSNLKFSPSSGTSSALGSGNGGHAAGFDGFFPGGGLFYTYSVSRDLKLGFAATGNFGAALKYDDDWVGRYYTRDVTLVGVSLLPSIAYRVNDQFSLGASVNAMYGRLQSRDRGKQHPSRPFRRQAGAQGQQMGIRRQRRPALRSVARHPVRASPTTRG